MTQSEFVSTFPWHGFSLRFMRAPRCLKLLPAFVLLAFTLPTKAENDPFGEADAQPEEEPATLRITADLIVVPVAVCDAMLAKPRKTIDDSDLREQARQMTAKGEASILDTVVLATLAGKPARNEAVQEFIYPTEYDPPEIPNSPPVVNPPADGVAVVSGPKTPFTAAAFDTRNLGTTLEVESMDLRDGKLADLEVSLDWTGFLGWQTYGKWKDEVAQVDLVMPLFYTMRYRARLLMLPGVPVLAGVLSPKGDDGMPDPKRKVLLFLRTEVLKPTK